MRFSKSLGVAVLVAGMTSLSSFASAATLNLIATLSAANEVPPVDGVTGTGTLSATYGTASRRLIGTLTFTGLSGDATAAHFHGPASRTENAGVIVPIPGPITSPVRFSVVLTPEQAVEFEAMGVQPPLNLGAAAAVIDSARRAMLYVNIHTAAHPGGEIRGQVGLKP